MSTCSGIYSGSPGDRRIFAPRRNHWRKGKRTAIFFVEWQTEIQNVVQKQN